MNDDHFNDLPFGKVYQAIWDLNKAHRGNMTELERAVVLHCQTMLQNVKASMERRHYETVEREALAERTASCL